jgi:hypothetical protein
MASFPGRSGRRRRVLNEEVLSASSSHVSLRASAREGHLSGRAPRYSDAAAVDNHPLISDFVPRRLRSIALLILGGAAMTAIIAALHHFAAPILATIGGNEAELLNLAAASSLAAWISAVLFLAAGAGCMLVHSIRRHRIDDFRGRYRVWRWAAALCLLASMNCVVRFHSLLADAVSYQTGWSALRDGAVWWLVLAGIPVVWFAVRTLLDVGECRLAALFLFAAFGLYATATVSFLQWLPVADPSWEPLITGSTALFGHWLLLAAIVTYARHTVLDAQGLTAARRRSPALRGTDANCESANSVKFSAAANSPHSSSSSVSGKAPMPIIPIKSAASRDQWVDGCRPHREPYEDDDSDADDMDVASHKLSKAERKRLRKLKAQRRAA